MFTETIRLIREGGYGDGGRGRLYTYHYTVTTRMTSALRCAAMRAILMFHNCEGQSHKTVSTDHNIWREKRAKADLNRSPIAYQPNALPLGHTSSQVFLTSPVDFILPRMTGQAYFYTPGQEEAVFLSDLVSVREKREVWNSLYSVPNVNSEDMGAS